MFLRKSATKAVKQIICKSKMDLASLTTFLKFATAIRPFALEAMLSRAICCMSYSARLYHVLRSANAKGER